jgi:hypothetical protein
MSWDEPMTGKQRRAILKLAAILNVEEPAGLYEMNRKEGWRILSGLQERLKRARSLRQLRYH